MDGEKRRKTDTEEVRKIKVSNMGTLNDDCLREIFEYLDLPDRIRIERVCKKWKYLSQNSWRKYNSLDFLKKTWGVKHILFVDSLKQNINFDKAINLCGRYVTNVSSDLITFSKICYFLPCAKELQIVDICVQPPGKCHIEPELDSYPQYRRNIFEIHQQCSYPFWFIVYRWLLSHAKNITSFQIKFSHTYYKEFQLYTLLYEMKYLKLFHLHRCDFLMCRGEFLLHLPFDTIEEINLSSNESLPFDNNILSSVINKSKKLKKFACGPIVKSGIEPILRDLPLHVKSLKSLKLVSKVELENQSRLFLTMSRLIHLEKLCVTFSLFVTDEFLEHIAKHLKKLTYLNILGCDRVTDKGISSICNLEKLTYLNIIALQWLRNPPLEELKNLVILEADWNLNIPEENWYSFLEKPNQLQALSIANCFFITDKFLNIAVKIGKERHSVNAPDLHIYVSEKEMIKINFCDPNIRENSYLLNVIRCGKVSPAQYGIASPFREIKYPEICLRPLV